MKYIVFLTENIKDSRIYIGIHKTENPEVFDGYIGDGVWVLKANTFKYPKSPFQCAVKKFGTNSFRRITLYIIDTFKEAVDIRNNLLTVYFIKQTFVYNTVDVLNTNKIYQFDKSGKLIKSWNNLQECSDFYSYPIARFNTIIDKCLFLNCYWSYKSTINKSDFLDKYSIVYEFTKEGKLFLEWLNLEECAFILGCSIKDIKEYIKNQTLINDRKYISNKVTDLFIPKPRRQYLHQFYYVYTKDNEFLGKFKGKEVMKIIDNHSWKSINNIFTLNNGWYKNFYLSFTEVDKVPEQYTKKRGFIDVYDIYGNFIERINDFKEIKDKYNLKSSQVKRIQQGEKYFNDNIFKYSK